MVDTTILLKKQFRFTFIIQLSEMFFLKLRLILVISNNSENSILEYGKLHNKLARINMLIHFLPLLYLCLYELLYLAVIFFNCKKYSNRKNFIVSSQRNRSTIR